MRLNVRLRAQTIDCDCFHSKVWWQKPHGQPVLIQTITSVELSEVNEMVFGSQWNSIPKWIKQKFEIPQNFLINTQSLDASEKCPNQTDRTGSHWNPADISFTVTIRIDLLYHLSASRISSTKAFAVQCCGVNVSIIFAICSACNIVQMCCCGLRKTFWGLLTFGALFTDNRSAATQ